MAGLIWDRTAESIAQLAAGADGCFRFAVCPDPEKYPIEVISCGLAAVGAVAPDGVSHGLLIDYANGKFCVVEDGIQKSPWMWFLEKLGDYEALIFRVYRVAGQVLYTIDKAPFTAYTTSGWEAAQFAAWDTAHEWDNEPHSFNSFSYAGTAMRGKLVWQSEIPSMGAAHLAVAFSRQPYDQYGDEVNGSLYGAALLRTAAAQPGEDSIWANLPTVEVRLGDDADNELNAQLPAVDGYATDYVGGYCIAELPAVQVQISDKSPFDISYDYISVELPAVDVPESERVLPVSIPAITCRAGDGDYIRVELAPIAANVGDGLNGIYVELPSLSASLIEEYTPTGIYGAVGIFLGLSASSVVIDPMALPSQPLVLLTSGDGEGFGENTLPTTPMGLRAGIQSKPFAHVVLGTSALRFTAGVSGSTFAEAALQTEPLGLLADIEADIHGDAYLDTAPLVLLLGGRLGDAPIGRVFCMNAATGGTTEYTGFAFNSVAKIGGRYYGANEQGLFLLEGETDNGTPIAANFGFGQLDFGAAQMKTLAYCYLGTQAGKMRLTVDALVDGKPAQYSYAARQHGASMRGIRFDLGRGMRSTYVMPTFSNVGGQDFEVDAVRFMATASSRRVQK